MADIESNIHINIDTRAAQASLKTLAGQISAFQQEMAAAGGLAAQNAANMQRNLAKSINQTGKWNASMTTVKSTTESFTHALENNKLSMGEYFRYAGASTKTFGKLFKNEFTTINKVARERVKDLQSQYIKLGRTANGSLQAIKVRPLALDMENLSTKTQMAAQRQAMLNQLLKQGSTQLLNWGKNTQWAGRQLMVGFSVPLMMLGTTAAKTFMEMEQAVVKFQRVYGDMNTTMADTKAMTDNMKKLASEFTKYGISVSDTMDMAAQAAAAGKTGADLIAQVTQANKLAVLGGVDQQKALETTMSLTNAFGISAEDLTSKINFLNAAENQTVTSIDDLTTAIPKAAPVVKQLGGNVEDLTFFLTAMREGGINASEGANALKSGLASMINPTKAASQFLGNLGINIKGIVEANKGDVKGMVMGLANALNTLDPLNRARAIEQLFGKFQFARMSTLFQNVVKEGSQAQKVLGLMRATKEELAILSEREMKKVEDSPMFKFKKALEDAKAALVPIGGEFLKAVTPVMKWIGDMLKKFNDMGDGPKQFFINLGLIIAGLGPVVLMTVGLIANGVANVIKLFTGVKSVFNAVGNRGKDLGSQVKYMTEEQLNAAAAASSLEQSHQKLTQVYSSEAEALRLLITEYRQMVALQSSMRGPVMGRGPVVKAATGLITGPGTGTSDSIPAMLSNGEAVIPAKSVKKYPGMVQGLIAGNIPGFAKGKGFKNATMFLPESWNTAMGPGRAGVPMEQMTQYLRQAGSASMAPLMAVMANEMGMRINSPQFKAEWERVGGQLSNTVISALERSGKTIATDKVFEEYVVPALLEDAKQLDVAGRSIAGAMNNAVNEIRTVAPVGVTSGSKGRSQAGAVGGRTFFRGSYGAGSIRRDAQNFATESKPSMFQRMTRWSESRQRNMSEFRTLNPFNKQWEVGTMAHLTESINLALSDLAAKMKPYLGEIGERLVKATGNAVVAGVKKETKQKSPSKEAENAGRNIGKGSIKGIKAEEKEATAAGKELGRAVANGASQAKINSAKTAGMIGAAYRSDATLKNLEIQRRQAEMMKADTALIEKEIAERKAVIASEIKLAQANAVAAAAAEEKAGFTGSAPLPAGMQGPIGPNDKRKISSKDRFGRVAKFATGGGRANQSIGMGMMMASSMGMMLPGAAGQAMQSMMMPLMGASTAMMMLPGNIGLVVGGLIMLAGVVSAVSDHIKKAGEEAYKLGKAIGTSNESLQKFATFTNKVSGTEAMNRRRQDSASQYFNVVEGKKTFGESYMESDAGKQMTKDFSSAVKKYGLKGAEKAISAQLSEAVASGIMSTDQARSIASSLGAQMQDMNIGMNIAGNITSIMGPNGENLSKEPLQVALAVVAQSKEQFNASAKNANQTVNGFNTAGTYAKGGAFAAGGGLAAGAIASGLSTAVGAAVSSELIASTALTAAVASGPFAPIVAGVAAIAAFTYQVVQYQTEVSRVAGELQANLENTLAAEQQMIDSLQIGYEKRIADAKAAGDTAEAIRLQNQYLIDQQALMNANKQTTTDMYKALDQQATGFLGIGDMQSEMGRKAEDSIRNVFKDMLPQAEMAINSINSMAASNNQKTMLKSMLAQKQIGFSQIETAKNLFGNDQAGADQLQKLLTNSPTEANRTLGLAANLRGSEQKKFVVDMSLKDPVAAKQMNDAIELAQKTTGVFFGEKKTAEAVMTFAIKNPEKMLEFKQNIDALSGEKQIRLDVEVAKDAGKDVANSIKKYWNAEFNKYGKGQKVTFVAEYQQLYSMWMNGDKDLLASYKTWLTNHKGKSMGDYIAFQADRTVSMQGAAPLAPGNADTTGTGGSGPSASMLDDVVKRLRDYVNWQQKLTIGWAASKKAIEAFKNTSTATFNGLMNKIAKQGVDATLLQQILGLSKEDYDKYKSQLIDKYGKLTKFGQQLAKVNRVTFLGEMVANNNVDVINSNTAAIAIQKLTKAGLDYARAAEVASDPTKAMAIALGSTAQAAAVAKSAITSAATAFKNLPENQKLTKDNELWQAGLDVISKQEDDINKTYQDRVDALDKIQSLNQGIAQAQQDQMDYADALSRGDIAAAAKAAMNARKNNSARAVEDEKKALETSRDEQLKKLTVEINGHLYTRQELTDKIAANEKAITAELLKQKEAEYNVNHSAASSTSARDVVGAVTGTSTTNTNNNNNNNTHFDGQSAGNGMVWKKVNGKWTKVKDTTVVTPTGEVSAATLGGGLKDNKIDNAKKTSAIASALKSASRGGAITDVSKDLMTKVNAFGTSKTAFLQKYAAKGATTLAGAQKVFKNDIAGFNAWQAAFSDLQGKAKAIQGMSNGLEGQSFNLGDVSKMQFNFTGNTDPNVFREYVDPNAAAAAQTANKEEAFKLLPAELRQAITFLQGLPDQFKTDKTTYSSLQSSIDAARNAVIPNYSQFTLAQLKAEYDKATKAVKPTTAYGKLIKKYPDIWKTQTSLGSSAAAMLKTQNIANSLRDQISTLGYSTDDLAPWLAKTLLTKNVDGLSGSAWKTGFPGKLSRYASGGMVLPKRFVEGGFAIGTDTVPAMLTPGEFVVSQPAVKSFGVDNLKAINTGTYGGDSMYNYSVNVNVATGADASQIADAVITKIKRIDDQRLRGNNF